VQASTWDGIVGFVKELAIRIFLFNTVRLLLTIALLGGDAGICVYVVGHFGVVAGLGFVVAINVLFSMIFIYIMLRYNRRAAGKTNMQFGASLMQGIQDVAKSRAAFEGNSNGFTGRIGSEGDHASPRSWSNEEYTPRAFGEQALDAERKFRRTVSGTVLAERA
jgi:uncharacterized membrane protein